MPLIYSFKHGARYRLTWLVLACVLPMLALIVLIVVNQYRYDREQLIHKSILTARAMALTVDKDLDSVKIGLHALASSPHLESGDLKAFHRQATDILHKLKANDIYMADASGQLLLHTQLPAGAPLPATRNMAIIKTVLATGESAVSDLFTGRLQKCRW